MAQTHQARFKQEGTSIDHTPGLDVAAGDVVVQSALVGIAKSKIVANEQGAITVAGVANFVKITGTIAVGIALSGESFPRK